MNAVLTLTGPVKIKFRIFGITLGYMKQTVKETWSIPFDFGTWSFPIKIKGVNSTIVFGTDGKSDLKIEVVISGFKVLSQEIPQADVVNFITLGRELNLPIKFNDRGVNADLILNGKIA